MGNFRPQTPNLPTPGKKSTGAHVQRIVENLVKAEDNVDVTRRRRRCHSGVVSPADPLITLAAEILTVQSEVGVTDLIIGELTKSAGQLTIADRAVVREVVQVHVGASTIALTRIIRDYTIYDTMQNHIHTLRDDHYTTSSCTTAYI